MANIEWVILSISLGFIIWVVATLDSNPVQQRDINNIQVQYVEDSSGDVVRTSSSLVSSRRVTVTIRAPRDTWDRITSDDVRVVADLEDLVPGTHMVKLRGELVNDDLLGRVISVSPEEMSIELVEVSERLIQVVPEISQAPSAEYIPSITSCDPQQVTVRGPAPDVSRVASAITRLDLTEAVEPVTVRSPIVLFNAANRPVINLTTEPETVTCQVDVQLRQDAVSVQVVANITGTLPDGYNLVEDFQITPAEILVTGDANAIAGMNNQVFTEVIDITDQRENFSRNVGVILPDGVRLRQPTQRVTVSVTIIEQRSTRTFAIPVQVANLDIGLNVQLSPATVNVDVTGPQSLVSSLTAEDISVTVDLAGLGEGQHNNIAIRSALLRESLQNAGIEVVVQPETVNLTLAPDAPTPTPRFDIIGKAR